MRFLELRGDERGERFSSGKGRAGISGFLIRLCSQIGKKKGKKRRGIGEVELKLLFYHDGWPRAEHIPLKTMGGVCQDMEVPEG